MAFPLNCSIVTEPILNVNICTLTALHKVKRPILAFFFVYCTFLQKIVSIAISVACLVIEYQSIAVSIFETDVLTDENHLVPLCLYELSLTENHSV